MKSESWIILELEIALLTLAGLSFFRTPVYEKAVWFIIGVLASAFTRVIGYKFGKAMPQQASDSAGPAVPPGTTVKTSTSSEVTKETAPV